jgi:biopolymer transport protein ExbB
MGLAAGVSEALIATAGGLGISLVALVFYSFFRGRVHNCISELESAATHFIALLHAQQNDEKNAELPVSAKRRDLQGI